MIAVKELKRWLDTLVSDEVGIDEGGLNLVAGDPEADSGAYLEIGGIPLDEEDDDFESELDHWSSPNGCHPDCPACAEERRGREYQRPLPVGLSADQTNLPGISGS
jgi:hypothetical protein